ncbi:MAG: FkbM family methyltransferase [Pseudomonadota bacterium]
MDVGANPLSAPPYEPLLARGCADVLGFEPQEDAHAALEKAAPEHARFVCAAVGSGEPGILHQWAKAPGMASLYPLRGASARYLGRFRGLAGNALETPVETRRLDDIHDVPDIDLLKIDVQGAERDIIRGGERKLAGAVAIITEMRFYRLYRGEPAFGALDLELRRQGFVLHKFLPMARTTLPSRLASRLSRKAKSQIIDGDAVYIRPLENIAAWQDDALMRLALCAAGAFGSHDMVLMILDELERRRRVGSDLAESYVAALPADMRSDEVLAP